VPDSATRRQLGRCAVFSLLLLLTAGTRAAELPPPWLPLDPLRSYCRSDAHGIALDNIAVRFVVRVEDRHLYPAELDNGFTQEHRPLTGELFTVTPRGGTPLVSGRFTLSGAPACSTVPAQPGAARAAERRAGAAVDADLVDPASGLRVHWRALLRDGTNYLREELTFQAAADLDLARVALIALELPGGHVAGTVSGSPLIAGHAFFGFEHPMAEADIVDGHATMMLRRVLPLRAGVPVVYSAVLGVAPAGQLRRGFAAYLENERAAPFRTFLHYNSWYDIGYFTPYTEADALAAIAAFSEHLARARGVQMDSFLFDDGWDDHAHLWQFSKDFPHGFTPLREAAQRIAAGVGVWLSPWGGYGKPRVERLATARAAGYEIDDQGLALSGPKYYALFHEAAQRLLNDYGVNQLKIDGTGSPDKVTPGSDFDSDFAAAMALIADLRAVRPDLFINLTTGTWPSPFWLRSADSIWRGGEDHSFAGTGTNRQRWITYRDGDTYGGIVRQGPLFPLNSLMLHGIIYARHAHGLDADPHDDFADEVHDYFATGTGLQELYVSPDLLSERNWDTLAETARWARRQAAVLRDSHWIGGDPARGEIYGFASWAPKQGVLALRNPAGEAGSFGFVLAELLELPRGEPARWRATPAFGHGRARELRADGSARIELKPYEVVVLDLAPSSLRRTSSGAHQQPSRPGGESAAHQQQRQVLHEKPGVGQRVSLDE